MNAQRYQKPKKTTQPGKHAQIDQSTDIFRSNQRVLYLPLARRKVCMAKSIHPLCAFAESPQKIERIAKEFGKKNHEELGGREKVLPLNKNKPDPS